MENLLFDIYFQTNTLIGKFIRLFLFLVALLPILNSTENGLLEFWLAFLALVIINEIFIEQIGNTKPKSKVSTNPSVIQDSLIFSARKAFESGKSGYGVIKKLENSAASQFFKKELGLGKIEESEIPKNELLKQTFEMVSHIGGEYITEPDLFASYIIIQEGHTRFLQKNNLNNQDVLNILYWARRKFGTDKFEHRKIYLTGPGIFDNLVYGWNYELKKYSKDLTAEVLSKKFIPSIIGEEKKYQELVVALSKHGASNAIIVGDQGTGKSALVEYLTYKVFTGDAPKEISHRKVFELLVDKLISGVESSGDLENRLSSMLSEIEHSGNAIVLIQNIENIFGGGGFGLDISGVLEEYLRSEKVKIIGTTTRASFGTDIEPKPSISNLFEKVELPQADPATVLLLLTEKAAEISKKYNIEIKYSGLKQTVVLSSVYFPDRYSPGRDIELLESAASKAHIEKHKIIDQLFVTKFVQGKTNVALDEPDQKEKDLLMNLEENLHKRIIGQDRAVSVIADAMRRVRSGFRQGDHPIGVFLFLGPTGVGKTETAKALSKQYFGKENPMIRLDMSEYQTQDQIKRLIGSQAGEEYIANTLTELVEKEPFCLVLLDEFEKAHPEILNLFLQVFDEGRLTDNKGKTVSFKNTIIIATSNAGTELLRENKDQNISRDELVDYLLKNNLFKPELLNRFDEVVLFNFLKDDEIKQISKILLSESLRSLEEKQIKLNFDDKVSEKISKESVSPEFGARNIRRYIEDNIESFVSKQILEGKINKGDQKEVSVDENNNFIVR